MADVQYHFNEVISVAKAHGTGLQRSIHLHRFSIKRIA
jgi:hypothetical protein